MNSDLQLVASIAGACQIMGKDYAYIRNEMMKTGKYPERVLFRFKKPCYLRVIRDNTEVIARRMGFDEDQVFELGMIVDEAYTNAVEHGVTSSGDTELEIEFLIYADRLVVSVKDTGCGFDLSCVPVPKNLRSLNSTRGRGLGLISMLSDSYELISAPGNGTVLRLTKYIVAAREFVA